MSQVVWQVRKSGKYYGTGISDNVETNSPFPFDEYVGTNLPADFDGDVVRRQVFDKPKFPNEGWVPHISQREYTEMYGGPNG